ncbi:MAG: hypothetical protein E7600_07540 [Ruminococcaceae bacterium]|nr:hypothetical protein [Oscillospiraceae bacterium]
MAHLTGSQKKKRNIFIALCIAIVLVVAAIALVVYNGITVASFGNETVEKAVAESLGGKNKAGSLKKDDLAKYTYVELSNVELAPGSAQFNVALGKDDFIAALGSYNAEQDVIAKANSDKQAKLDELYNEALDAKKAEKTEGEWTEEDQKAFDDAYVVPEVDVVVPEAKIAYPEKLLKSASTETSGALINMNDIKYFTGAKTVNILGGKVDINNLKGLKNLSELTITASKIENFEELAKLDYSKIKKITIDVACEGPTNNMLNALKPYGEKIYLAEYYNYGYGMIMNAGEISLADYFKSLEEAEKAPEEEVTEPVVEPEAEPEVEPEVEPETTPEENGGEPAPEDNTENQTANE